MAPAFSKEAILAGTVDYLCLVCEGYLSNKHEISQHIATPSHRENLKSTGYTDIEKFKNDCIRKVKRGYFCEVCNVLLPTKTKVSLHVAEEKHNQNKLSNMIERVGEIVIVSGNVAINTEAWHGLIENTCTLCNIEFDIKEDHVKEPIHVINLIQINISETDENIYRKVDASTFHCLTCNELVVEIRAHFNDTKHKNLLLQRSGEVIQKRQEKNSTTNCITESLNNNKSILDDDVHTLSDLGTLEIKSNVKNIENNNVSIDNKPPFNLEIDKDHEDEAKKQLKFEENIKASENDRKETSDILNNISKFQKNNINVNFESHTAVCKTCSTHLEFKTEVIEQHIEEHKNIIQKKQVAKESIPSFAKGLNDKKRDNKTLFSSPVYLKRRNDEKKECSITTSAEEKIDNDTYKAVDEYNLNNRSGSPSNDLAAVKNELGGSFENTVKLADIQSSKRSEITKKLKQMKKCDFKRVEIDQFTRHVAVVSTSDDIFIDCILNEQYCINAHSFVFIKITGGTGYWCHCCEVNVSRQDGNRHLTSENHYNNICRTLVVIHPGSEFIREIRPETFHCGFCNIVKNCWEEMEVHLKCTAHKESRTFAYWRAAQYQQQKYDCDTQEQFNMDCIFKHLKPR